MKAATFALGFVPRWLDAVEDPAGGLFERLDRHGRPVDPAEPKTTLVHARTVFALAHLALGTGNARLLDAARRVHGTLDTRLRDADGGYRASTQSAVRRAYDQSFVLLALTTLARADPSAVPAGRVEACLRFVTDTLTDPADGALFEDDIMAARGPRPGDLRAQNPHMHMLEACLQAFEMTGEAHWMAYADRLLALARRHFIDPDTGAIREFVGPRLEPLAGADGALREPGHQYEWAWLLNRLADLGGDDTARVDAGRMMDFAGRFATRRDGLLAGAPFDALDAAGRVTLDTHLLWPATEAGKLHALMSLRTGHHADRARANRLADIVFGGFFADATAERPIFVNRLDGMGVPLWPEALTRLVYHVALFVTEGVRAGLWIHEEPAARPN